MCGIFGSRDFNIYEKLYIGNKVRGTFAGGSLYAGLNESIYLKKWEGVKQIEELTGEYAMIDSYNIFLGHTQAPTGTCRDYNTTTTHPFEHGRWFVAHNGVLENDKHIREAYLDDMQGYYKGQVFNSTNIPVDSAVIPALIDNLHVGSDVKAIEEALSTLKGTFACWMYNKETGQTYIARSGSTIFADINTGVFSSTLVSNVAEEPLEEGVIYCVTMEGITPVGTFHQNSPFFLF